MQHSHTDIFVDVTPMKWFQTNFVGGASGSTLSSSGGTNVVKTGNAGTGVNNMNPYRISRYIIKS